MPVRPPDPQGPKSGDTGLSVCGCLSASHTQQPLPTGPRETMSGDSRSAGWRCGSSCSEPRPPQRDSRGSARHTLPRCLCGGTATARGHDEHLSRGREVPKPPRASRHASTPPGPQAHLKVTGEILPMRA